MSFLLGCASFLISHFPPPLPSLTQPLAKGGMLQSQEVRIFPVSEILLLFGVSILLSSVFFSSSCCVCIACLVCRDQLFHGLQDFGWLLPTIMCRNLFLKLRLIKLAVLGCLSCCMFLQSGLACASFPCVPLTWGLGSCPDLLREHSVLKWLKMPIYLIPVGCQLY